MRTKFDLRELAVVATWGKPEIDSAELFALVRLARAALKCHPDTFISTPDEVAEYIEAASAFTDSAEAK